MAEIRKVCRVLKHLCVIRSVFIKTAQVLMDVSWLTKFEGTGNMDWDAEIPHKGFMPSFFSQHPLRSLGIRWWESLQDRTPGPLCFPWCGVKNGLMKEELLLPGCLCFSLCNSNQVGCSWQVSKRIRVALHNVLLLNYLYLPLAWLIFLVLMRLITRLINMCPKCERATWSVGSHDPLLYVTSVFQSCL